jgi:ABC-type transport system substrate-binding protein
VLSAVVGFPQGAGRGRNQQSKWEWAEPWIQTVPRGAAAAVLVALLALTTAPGVTAQEQPAGKLTFTVGIVNDVDSLNPFIGILSESYEVWALMYDYLVGHSQKDFSPVPGLAESWEVSPTSSPGPTRSARA